MPSFIAEVTPVLPADFVLERRLHVFGPDGNSVAVYIFDANETRLEAEYGLPEAGTCIVADHNALGESPPSPAVALIPPIAPPPPPPPPPGPIAVPKAPTILSINWSTTPAPSSINVGRGCGTVVVDKRR